MENKSVLRGDDKLRESIEVYREALEPLIGREGINAAIAMIPYVGSSILSIMNDLVGRRLYERSVEVFGVIKERLEHVEEAKINKEFFRGEEFQTLLFLALEQLRTSHDRDTRLMLSNALANSGLAEFSSEERKELFLRILRDLSPSHIRTLKALLPAERHREAGPTFWPYESNPNGEQLAILQYLSGTGLVAESLNRKKKSFPAPRFGNQWTESDVKRAIEEYVNMPSLRQFRISSFGLDFLKFVGGDRESEKR
jgi:hypothetical protein